MHQQLCALKDILRSITQLEEAIQATYHISLTEAMVLCAIDGGCRYAHDLAEDVGLSPSRLSRIIAGLERKGLLEREQNREDRRHWQNRPTEAGKAILAHMKTEGIDIPPALESIILVHEKE
jgi:DNA-binding MarR family transcriptional regulator